MARNTFESWIPEEFDSAVIMRVKAVSAVEALATPTPMKSDTKSVPRSAGVDVEYIAKGGAYGEDTTGNDSIVLTAQKFGKAIRIADEDISDSLANIVATKQIDWATSYAKMLDNASLAVTAAAVGVGVPFVSVYASLHDTQAALSYTADDNLTLTGTGGSTYAGLSASMSKVEQGDYFDLPNMVVIAHPAFRDKIRNVKDDQHRPIFIQGVAGTPDTLFGLPISWSLGAKTSAVATPSPAGYPCLFVANKQYLRLGVRSGPETHFIDADGVGALTDEAILKLRARRGFGVGNPHAFSVLVDNS